VEHDSIASDPHDLLLQIERGEQSAAEEFVRRYLPEIRRAVRVRLTDPRLRRVLDSVDVCQSVFANFFVRVSMGEYDLNHPGDLAALLIAMARNKLLDHVRRLQSRKRDQRRMTADGDEAMASLRDSAEGPAEIAANKDLLAEVRQRMTADERQLVDLRAAGLEWPEIAAQLGAAPDALRKKFTRAIDRIAHQLGLSEFQS
jgi:RNA polymerase sigma-70 factor (ECF subfamily)